MLHCCRFIYVLNWFHSLWEKIIVIQSIYTVLLHSHKKISLNIMILMKFSLLLLQFIRQLCNYRPYHWVKLHHRSHKPCKAQWRTSCPSQKHCRRAVHGMDQVHQDHHHHEQPQEVANIRQIVQVNHTNKANWTHFKTRATRRYCQKNVLRLPAVTKLREPELFGVTVNLFLTNSNVSELSNFDDRRNFDSYQNI